MNADEIRRTVESVRLQAQEFLCGLIQFPSTPGNEAPAMEYLRARFSELGNVCTVPLPEGLDRDPEYSPLVQARRAGGYNLVVSRPGAGSGRSLILNTHLDVVPPTEDQRDAFCPRLENGFVSGRGACDAKGQVATVFAAFLALERLGAWPAGPLQAHFVVEEEPGGNGSLAMIRTGGRADGCLVLEPTGLQVMAATRGAVWFRIACRGLAAHSGEMAGSRSALGMVLRAMAALEEYHGRLRCELQGAPPMPWRGDSLPLLFGRLTGGLWPSMVPSSAQVEGVLGFLPNKNRRQIMQEVRDAMQGLREEWVREHLAIDFPYRHDCHVLPPGHPLPQCLLASARQTGIDSTIAAMNASCDAWLYQNELGVPTVVFGAGDLRLAHSGQERIAMDDIVSAAATLVAFIGNWCGLTAT